MTNNEALNWLTDLRSSLSVPCGSALSEERKQFAEAVDVAIEALSRDRWISVEERVPEKLERVLVFCEDGVSFGYFEEIVVDDEFVKVWHDFLYYAIPVTHWMPLPEPPKEET